MLGINPMKTHIPDPPSAAAPCHVTGTGSVLLMVEKRVVRATSTGQVRIQLTPHSLSAAIKTVCLYFGHVNCFVDGSRF